MKNKNTKTSLSDSKKERVYKINSAFFTLKDEKSVKYHLEKNDYFGTIATIISLARQKIKNREEKDEKGRKEIVKILKNLEDDLSFLQKNYQLKIDLKTSIISAKLKKLNKTENKKEENNTKR